ncbi:MAG: hypothetical protein WCP95_13340 [Actinomycetes bacterium]
MTNGPASSDEGAPARGTGRAVVLGLLAAAVLVAAVAGAFVVGRQTAPGPRIVVAPGPVVEESPAASSLPVSGVVPSNGPTRPSLQVPTVSSPSPAIFSPAVDLADTPGVASGYRLTRGQVDGDSFARSVAGTFGVTGDVGRTLTGWQVGDPSDAASSSLVVTDNPLVTWQFADRAAAADSSVGVAVPAQQALEVATALLGSLGVDVAAVDMQVDRFADRTRVTAWQKVNGARTQLSWTVGLGRAGAVVSASGFAAGLVEIPGYPVVGAATAVRRASLPTWAVLGPRTLDAAQSSAEPTPSARPTLNASGRPALRVPMSDVVVTGAELALAQFWQPDGDLLILPAYRLTGDDGSQWSLIAVTGDDVSFIDVPYPSATPPAP